jgi:hypothetical protein
MGRHRWTSRLTVEQCPLCLCVASFHRAGLFTCPAGTSNTLTWTMADGEWLGRLECRLDSGTGAASGLAIYIHPQLVRFGMPVDEQTIPVTTVRPNLGSKRYWLVCACGKRAGRLYLPPGQRVLRCRGCYNLTYRSSQQHNKSSAAATNAKPLRTL